MARWVKNLLAMQETQILSLGREDPLEEGMATHSSILAWRIAWIEEPVFNGSSYHLGKLPHNMKGNITSY